MPRFFENSLNWPDSFDCMEANDWKLIKELAEVGNFDRAAGCLRFKALDFFKPISLIGGWHSLAGVLTNLDKNDVLGLVLVAVGPQVEVWSMMMGFVCCFDRALCNMSLLVSEVGGITVILNCLL